MNKGESITFNYTGNIQNWTVADSGVYQLEVWAAQGGGYHGFFNDGGWYDMYSYGGNGGYAKGSVKLKKGTVIYIGVGGQGGGGEWDNSPGGAKYGGSGGYNGGTSGSYTGNYCSGGSGGQTHIATETGVTPSQDKLYIKAGGGGGGYYYLYSSPQNGSAGSGQYFGNNVTEITRTNGVKSGNGQCKITLTKKTTVYLGDTEADALYVGDNEVDALYVGDNEA